jgi:Tol biopolymer transport system component/DNA-binding winged helix-turn-helix (wHTH) protein
MMRNFSGEAARALSSQTNPAVVQFGTFTVDLSTGELSRGGRPVALQNQPARVLCLLVSNAGQLVTRKELHRALWSGDTFVEFETALNIAVAKIRQALGDDAGSPRFIETLPRRGYRFIAEVYSAERSVPRVTLVPSSEAKATVGLGAAAETTPVVASVEQSKRLAGTRYWIGWLVTALAAGAIGVAAFWAFPDRPRPAAATPELTPRLSRVTNLGTVVRAAISPDGRSLAYAVSAGARESLWVKGLDSAKPVQLIEPRVGTYRRGGGLAIAPNGGVYYAWFRPDLAAVGIFRIHPRDGQPERLLNVWDLPSFDAAGNRFACITTTSSSIRDSRLLVYDASGTSPRVIAMRVPPGTFLQVRPAWSPDGKRLAVWTMSERTPGVRELIIVGVDDRRERVVSRQQLHAVDGTVWLPDGSSVIVAARERASSPLRLWQIALAAPVIRPLTTDTSDYLLAGLTDDGRRLAAVRVEVARSLWVAPLTDTSRARQVGSDAGELAGLESVAWMPDGRVLYTSAESGNADIWVLDPARGTRRQLTTDAHDDFNPASSPDGRTIVFASDRSGTTGLWSMSDAGETSVRPLTSGGDSRPSISADGWVVFQRGVIQSSPVALWKIPLEGGTAAQLTDGTTIRPVVSPDGRLIAHYWLTPERWALAVVPVDGGQPVKVFQLSSTHCGRTVRWSRDSRALAYIDCVGGAANIWLRPLDGSPARRLTNFTSGHIDAFDWSHDGSQLAWITRSQVSDVVLIELPRPTPPS